MLEKIDLAKKIGKKEYKEAREELGLRLGELQRKCRDAQIPVLITFDGFDAAGKGLQVNRLIQSLDPRGFAVYTGDKESEEERLRPFLWRYWVKTPANGRIVIFDTSWYKRVQMDRFDGSARSEELGGAFQDILSFERQLSDSGVVLIKLFLYISEKEQRRRFEKLDASKETSWRVSAQDWKRNKHYKKYLEINEEMLERTDTGFAPWTIVEAEEKDYAAVKIMTAVADRLELELRRRSERPIQPEFEDALPEGRYKNGALSKVDLTKSLTDKEYKSEIDRLQKRLEVIHSELYRLRIPVLLGFEGWDAGGKGGAIRRLTSHLDPRGYKVNPTAAPNDIEKVHHYLWRFWNEMPKAGHIAIFDRTWYGRVMVERIEGFCSKEDWQRAYREINEMEAHLVNFGAVVLKFWLQIDKDEQERRFNDRMKDPAKQWKITDEDWRNREKWDQYEEAVNEMLVRTSTTGAPWIIVEGNSKYYARVKVLRTVVDALEEKIKEVNKAKKKHE